MLNVAGRKPKQKSSKTSSDPLFCHPCGKDGRRLEAHGYCTDCCHYLCKQCFDVHTIPLPLRNHTLLDAETMPKTAKDLRKAQATTGTLTCPNHKSKIVDIYCVTHTTAVCGACAFKDHTSCKTEDIHDAACGLDLSQKYTDFELTIFNLRKDVATISNDADTHITKAEQSSDSATKALHDFRAKFNVHLDQVEQQLLTSGGQLKETDIKAMKELKEECETMDLELTNNLAMLKKHELNNNDLYVVLKQAEVLVSRLQQQLHTIGKKNRTMCYTFHADKTLKKFLESKGQLGNIQRKELPLAKEKTESSTAPKKSWKQSVAKVKMRAKNPYSAKGTTVSEDKISLGSATLKSWSDINIKATSDELECHVSGIAVLSSSTLLVCDHTNKSVKHVDMLNSSVTSSLTLADSPWDVAILPKYEAAVTLPWKHQILVIFTRDELSPVHTISVQGECHGISSNRDKLFVSYIELHDNPGKVEVMDHQGVVLHTISVDMNGQNLFISPYYLTTANEDGKDIIYVSDYSKSAVYKLTIAGQVIYTYKDWSMLCPTGLAVTKSGELLVCSWSRESIQLVSQQGSKVKAMLETRDKQKQMACLCWGAFKYEIYVSQVSSDTMQTYYIN